MTEHQLRQKVSEYFKSRPHWYMQKISDRWTSGIPDYIGCFRGMFVTLELKAKGQKPTALQKSTGRRIILANGLWLVIYSMEELKRWVLKIERLHFGLIKELRSSSAERGRSQDY